MADARASTRRSPRTTALQPGNCSFVIVRANAALPPGNPPCFPARRDNRERGGMMSIQRYHTVALVTILLLVRRTGVKFGERPRRQCLDGVELTPKRCDKWNATL